VVSNLADDLGANLARGPRVSQGEAGGEGLSLAGGVAVAVPPWATWGQRCGLILPRNDTHLRERDAAGRFA
jgi:hypothetical protein